MPERLHDAQLVNEIANHPDVGPFISYGHVFDFTEAVADDRYVFLHDDGGIAICSWSAPRIYECHLFFLPESRGRRAIEASKRMINHMIPTFCDALWAQVPSDNRRMTWLSRQLGYQAGATADHPQLGKVQYFTKGFPCLQ